MKRFQLFAVLGVLALLAAGCNVNWAQFRADATHSGTQSESVIGTANVALAGRQVGDRPRRRGHLGSPAIVSGIAYVSDPRRQGRRARRRDRGASSGPTVTGSAVAVLVAGGRERRRLRRLRQPQGLRARRHDRGRRVVHRHRRHRRVVAHGGERGRLRRLRGRQGLRARRHHRCGQVDRHDRQHRRVVAGGRERDRLRRLHDGKVYALDATTGAVKWTSHHRRRRSSRRRAVANGVVYVGSDDHKV